MSGVDPNYRHSGVFTGESGEYTIYSSDRAEAGKGEEAQPAGMSAADEKDFAQWKADQEYAEFQAFKKAQAEQKQQHAEPAAETN